MDLVLHVFLHEAFVGCILLTQKVPKLCCQGAIWMLIVLAFLAFQKSFCHLKMMKIQFANTLETQCNAVFGVHMMPQQCK